MGNATMVNWMGNDSRTESWLEEFPHVGVMSAAAFGDLPAVTTVRKSVGIFGEITIFFSKCGFRKTKSQGVVGKMKFQSEESFRAQ